MNGFWFGFALGAVAATAVLIFIPAAYNWAKAKVSR